MTSELIVVFKPRTPDQPPRWWQRWLHPARRHVLALWQDGSVTLAAEHVGSRLRIETMALPVEEAARGLMWAWQAEALRVPCVPVPLRGMLRPPMTCVEFVKALLGLHDWRIWTPQQLRRALIRHGARPVSPYRPWQWRAE